MFFKERFACILFSYQCSFSRCFISNSVILSCVANFVNNFFQLFSISFSLFQRRPLKLISVLSNRCCRVQQPWIIYTLSPTKVNNIFYYFFKMAFQPKRTTFSFVFAQHAQSNSKKIMLRNFPEHFLKYYLLNNSIPTFTLRIVSSLPMISMISVAPAGVICFPETAVLIGQSA